MKLKLDIKHIRKKTRSLKNPWKKAHSYHVNTYCPLKFISTQRGKTRRKAALSNEKTWGILTRNHEFRITYQLKWFTLPKIFSKFTHSILLVQYWMFWRIEKDKKSEWKIGSQLSGKKGLKPHPKILFENETRKLLFSNKKIEGMSRILREKLRLTFCSSALTHRLKYWFLSSSTCLHRLRSFSNSFFCRYLSKTKFFARSLSREIGSSILCDSLRYFSAF